jgi:AmpD protein
MPDRRRRDPVHARPRDAGRLACRASRFLGRDRCNDFLLGVAFAGDTYGAPLTDGQIASALEWLEARWEPLGWDPGRITDHRQASPGRKNDLNPVEWDRLAAAISGHFRGDGR